jgi:predicted AlkP superfamily pyrophosphatase or phosphodiesterase
MVLVQASGSLRLADVLSSCFLALQGAENPLALSPIKKAAVLVVDGLGAHNLRARSGHARWLHGAWSERSLVADSGFPSTTASALTSLTTGVGAGQHGIVGYTIRDPLSGRMINHLKEWAPTVDPDSWQLQPTLFERAAEKGISSLALGEPRFQDTDFTKAVWRGAQFLGVRTLAEQALAMREFFDTHDQALVYLYWPALDRAGHSQGVGSDAWTHRLEELDAEIAALAGLLGQGEGLVVTADHGMIDVPEEHKLILVEGSPLLKNVADWGGEPRVPQLYLDDQDALEDVHACWSEGLNGAAKIMTREQLLDEGWLGPVASGVDKRVGDLTIACIDSLVAYREAHASKASMAMVGQHGSLTAAEREIPVIPLGEWA